MTINNEISVFNQLEKMNYDKQLIEEEFNKMISDENKFFDHVTEMDLYCLLSKLGEGYRVKYSYWFHPEGSYNYPGGQLDFLLYKERKGFVFIECKSYYNDDKLNEGEKQVQDATRYFIKKQEELFGKVVLPVTNIIIFYNDSMKSGSYDLDAKSFVESIENCINISDWEKDINIMKSYFDEYFNSNYYSDIEIQNNISYYFENKKEIIDKFLKGLFSTNDKRKTQEIESKISILSKYKKGLLSVFDKNFFNAFLIVGKSGTGKTYLATELALEKLEKENNAMILFIVYSKGLLKYIKETLCQRCGSEFHVIVKDDRYNFVVKNNSLNSTLELYSNSGKEYYDYDKYNYIIIDELQDQSIEDVNDKYILPVIKQVKTIDIESTKLYLFGDSTQYLNDEDFDKKDIINEHLYNKNLLLIDLGFDNCRNEYNITKFVYKLIDNNYEIEHKIYICCEIVCVDNKKMTDYIIGKLNKIKDDCEKNDLTFQSIYLDKEELDCFSIFKPAFDIHEIRKNVGIAYINPVKGLEYDKVVVFGIKKEHLIRNEFGGVTLRNKELSLCCGRAKSSLFLIFSANDISEAEEIKDILIKDYSVTEKSIAIT